MTPKVTNVAERNTMDARGAIVKGIVLTYYVGQNGPFTLVTTQIDIDNGVANAKMMAFAQSISMLPGVNG